MKNKTPIIVAAMAGAAIFCAAGWFIYSWLTGGDIEDVAERLPEDTVALVAVRGFAELFLEFEDEISELSDSDEAEEALDEAEEILGVNPLDIESLAETGFSFGSPWAAALIGNPVKNDDAKMVFLIPVDDEEDALDYMDDRADDMDWDVDDEDIGDLEAFVIDEEFAWVIDDDYLILCLPIQSGSDGDDALDCLDDLVELDPDDSLAASEHFERAMDLADPDWNVLLYHTTEWIEDASKEFNDDIPGEIHDLMGDLIERVPAQVMTMAIDRDEIRIRGSQVLDSEYAHMFTMDGEDDLANRIPGEAVAVGRASSHLYAAWTVMMDGDLLDAETEDMLDDNLDQFEDASGIDIEEDLLANLTGHVSLIVLEAEKSRGATPVDVVIYASVIDDELALEMVENLVDMAEDQGTEFDKEEAGDSTYFILDEDDVEICLGVARDHLVAVIGPGRCEITFEGIDDGGETFLDELPGDVEDGLEDGPSNYGYVWMPKLIEIIESTSGSDDDELDVLEEMIESIEVQSWTEEDHTTVEVLIRPPADDFGPGLISWLELISESRAVDSYERRPSKGGKGYPGGTGQRGPY